MLSIRKEQMEAMRIDMLKRSYRQLQTHLQQRYPEHTAEIDNEQLQKLVITGIDQAKKYKVTDHNDVRRFLEYQIEYGSNFGYTPETQWAEPFLNHSNLTGTAKMDEIDNYALFVIKLGK